MPIAIRPLPNLDSYPLQRSGHESFEEVACFATSDDRLLGYVLRARRVYNDFTYWVYAFDDNKKLYRCILVSIPFTTPPADKLQQAMLDWAQRSDAAIRKAGAWDEHAP